MDCLLTLNAPVKIDCLLFKYHFPSPQTSYDEKSVEQFWADFRLPFKMKRFFKTKITPQLKMHCLLKR